MQDFKDLVAWQKALALVAEVYRRTGSFPKHETYGLTNQIRRAAVSVPSNIAEGQAHYSRREFCHFLHHSRGSLAELETQLILSERLRYISGPELESLLLRVREIGRILNGLISSLSEHKVA